MSHQYTLFSRGLNPRTPVILGIATPRPLLANSSTKSLQHTACVLPVLPCKECTSFYIHSQQSSTYSTSD
jgi:hypothetical protein